MKCRKCQQEKSKSEFDFRNDTKKYSTECKICRKNRIKKNYRKYNPPYKHKTKKCEKCENDFLMNPVINGKRQRNISRKYCYDCVPFKYKHTLHKKHIEEDKTGCRKCSVCEESYPLSSEYYYIHNNFSNRICKKCTSKSNTERQRRVKQSWIKYKGGECELCGYSKSPRALHFHHIDSTKKEFNLGDYRRVDHNKVKHELDKCMLVCANCHAEIHDS